MSRTRRPTRRVSTRNGGRRIGLLTIAMLVTAGSGGAAPAEDDDIVVVVSSSNPVETLARNELVDLFLGRTSRFPDGRQAVPIDLREGSPGRSAFYTAFLGRTAAQMKAHWSKIVFTGRGSPPREVTGGTEAKELIAEDPRAIGYLERGLVDDDVKIVEIR